MNEKKIHQMRVSKTISSYTWAFFLSMSIWMFCTLIPLFGIVMLFEAIAPGLLSGKDGNAMLVWVLIAALFTFVFWFSRKIKKRHVYYSGQVSEMSVIRGEGELNEVYRHFIWLQTADSGKVELRVDPETYGRLGKGMNVRILYDAWLGDARRVYLMEL